ncbi:uncharacterized protein LOC135398871 [Ornithodoros turicata]|uniref:uncharacterized protein LOC135398871 n=1 Tax=Ornithodoros turicata TaxID=34597 RepID=UPI0031395801
MSVSWSSMRGCFSEMAKQEQNEADSRHRKLNVIMFVLPGLLTAVIFGWALFLLSAIKRAEARQDEHIDSRSQEGLTSGGIYFYLQHINSSRSNKTEVKSHTLPYAFSSVASRTSTTSEQSRFAISGLITILLRRVTTQSVAAANQTLVTNPLFCINATSPQSRHTANDSGTNDAKIEVTTLSAPKTTWTTHSLSSTSQTQIATSVSDSTGSETATEVYESMTEQFTTEQVLEDMEHGWLGGNVNNQPQDDSDRIVEGIDVSKENSDGRGHKPPSQ